MVHDVPAEKWAAMSVDERAAHARRAQAAKKSKIKASQQPHLSSSYWLRSLSASDAVPLEASLPDFVDIVIVGAGLAGVSLAYHLARTAPSLSIAVLDRRGVSGGASGRNGGIVWPSASDPFEVRSASTLRAALAEHGLDAHWDQRGGVSLEPAAPSSATTTNTAEKGGVESAAVDAAAELGAAPGAFARASRHTQCAAVSSAKVVCGLARATLAMASARADDRSSSSSGGGGGGTSSNVFFVAPCIVKVINASARGVRVKTSRGVVRCDRIVVATNGWIPRLLRVLRPHFRACANTVLVSTTPVPAALRWPCAAISCGEGDEKIYASLNAYDGRIVLGGMRDSSRAGTKKGGDRKGDSMAWTFAAYEEKPHDRSIAADLEAWLHASFPALAASVTFDADLAWRGVLGFPRDGMPVVGEMPGRYGRVFVIGGFCGHGMPRCFGLAEALAHSLCKSIAPTAATATDALSTAEIEMEAAILEKWSVGRFVSGGSGGGGGESRGGGIGESTTQGLDGKKKAKKKSKKQKKQQQSKSRSSSDDGSATTTTGGGGDGQRNAFETILNRLDTAPRALIAPPTYVPHPFIRALRNRGREDIWHNVPAELRPGGERACAVPASRAARKRLQLENVLAVALAIVPPANGICVDFCSGAGHAGLLIAWALPTSKVVLVDCNEVALSIAAKRAAGAGLSNVFCVVADVKKMTMADVLAALPPMHPHGASAASKSACEETVDLGIALHACGAATDGAQSCCVESRCPFLLIPCCVGRLSHAAGKAATAEASKANTVAIAAAAAALEEAGLPAEESNYPKSSAVRGVMSSDEYDTVARAADFALTVNNRLLRDAFTPRELNRRRCKAWLEWDRQLWAVERALKLNAKAEGAEPEGTTSTTYANLTFLMEPHDASPKNDMLLGWCDGRELSAVVEEGRRRVAAAVERLAPAIVVGEGEGPLQGGDEVEAEWGVPQPWMMPAAERASFGVVSVEAKTLVCKV